jgi:hypothetical protein
MARSELTVQKVLSSGLNVTYTAATVDGEAFNNASEDVIVHIKNGGGGACVLTVQTPAQQDGLDVAERTVSVPAGEDRFVGPFRRSIYGRLDSVLEIPHAVWIDTDVQTSVTLAVLKVAF